MKVSTKKTALRYIRMHVLITGADFFGPSSSLPPDGEERCSRSSSLLKDQSKGSYTKALAS